MHRTTLRKILERNASLVNLTIFLVGALLVAAGFLFGLGPDAKNIVLRGEKGPGSRTMLQCFLGREAPLTDTAAREAELPEERREAGASRRGRAKIGPDGRVTLLEPVRLPQSARAAVVTILPPMDEDAPPRGSAAALRAVLDNTKLASPPPGDPECMEREIAANRNAWGDEAMERIYLVSCLAISPVEEHPLGLRL